MTDAEKAAAAAANPQPNPVSDAQRRIDQLFAQKKTAEENNAVLQSEKDELQTQMLQLQDKVSQLETGLPAGPDPAPGLNSSGDMDIGAILDQKFKQFEQKTLEREQADKARAALSSSQQQSFLAVQRQFPETMPAADGSISQEGKDLLLAAETIYRGDPALQAHPNGPLLATSAAKGVIAGTPAQADPATRAAASSGAASGGAPIAGGKTQEIKEAEELVERRKEEMQSGRVDPGIAWSKYHDAKIALGLLATPDKVGAKPILGPQQ